jgi:hypothetical protein
MVQQLGVVKHAYLAYQTVKSTVLDLIELYIARQPFEKN